MGKTGRTRYDWSFEDVAPLWRRLLRRMAVRSAHGIRRRDSRLPKMVGCNLTLVIEVKRVIKE